MRCFAVLMAWAAAVASYSDRLLEGLSRAGLLRSTRLDAVGDSDAAERWDLYGEVTGTAPEEAVEADFEAFQSLLDSARAEAARSGGCEGRYPVEQLIADGHRHAKARRVASEEEMIARASAAGATAPVPSAPKGGRWPTGGRKARAAGADPSDWRYPRIPLEVEQWQSW